MYRISRMALASTIVSVLLAALMAAAAIRKLTHRQDVVRSYLRAGVPEDRLDLLAAVLLAGATGLLIGLAWAPIGVAAAAATIVYFIGAVTSHIRARDAQHLPTPLAFEAMAVAALVLRAATA
jgi:DoxX-like family